MTKRQIIQRDIAILLKEFPAIAILGPRQVGKTTLALQLARQSKSQSLYFDLENDTDLKRMENAAFLFDQYQNECIIIDEVQREPHLFTALRPAIDKRRTAAFCMYQIIFSHPGNCRSISLWTPPGKDML